MQSTLRAFRRSTITLNKMNPFKIGLIGGGTVGGGVYELVMDRLKGSLSSSTDAARPMIISKICVRDVEKPRDFHIDPNHTEVVSDVNEVLDDDSIDLIVEVMGGTGLAKTVVLKALENKQHVVTANKALIAECLSDIQSSLQQNSSVKFGMEAAVCGGIPIIHILQSVYTGDVIHEIMGICNGTTNYMLGKMESGADYDEVLKEAQDLGFAEADPTADVEGHDVRAKIAILAQLAFGTTVTPVEDIPCLGISSLSSVDFEYAKLLHCTIKLVGTASRLSQYGEYDGPLTVYVTPKLVPLTHLLASARGSGNAVAVTSANLGTNSYTGPGAGRFPTANSVVSDICRIYSDTSTSLPFTSQISSSSTLIEIDNDYTSRFYIRISFRDSIGIIRIVGELCEKNGISIHSILQNPIVDRMAADFVVTTESCKYSQVQSLCTDIELQEFSRGKPLSMPMLLDE